MSISTTNIRKRNNASLISITYKEIKRIIGGAEACLAGIGDISFHTVG